MTLNKIYRSFYYFFQGKPVLSFDPEGLVFSVGVQSEQVKLYDLRSFEKGPFTTFKMPRETKCEWTGLRFRHVHVLIAQEQTTYYVIHKSDGNTNRTMNYHFFNIKPAREVHPPHDQRERHAVARCIRRKATSGTNGGDQNDVNAVRLVAEKSKFTHIGLELFGVE